MGQVAAIIDGVAPDFMDKKAGPAANIVIDASDVFTEKTHADKLCPNKDKEHRKQRKYALGSPLGAVGKSQHHQKDAETDAAGRDEQPQQ